MRLQVKPRPSKTLIKAASTLHQRNLRTQLFLYCYAPTVHTNPSRKWSFFENALFRPEEFENSTLHEQLDLPSTLIRHENGALWKRSSNRRNLKTSVVWFLCEQKTFWKRRVDGVTIVIRWFPIPRFSSNTNTEWPVIVVFSNFYGVV